MAIHGTLTTMSVSDLLQFLAAGRKTGTLKFTRNKVAKEIYFQDGIVVGANTNDPKEYLGQVMIRYGKLTEPQLRSAMEEQRRAGGRLGEILVAQGHMTEAAVLEILRTRTLDLIYDLFLWEEAHFEFFDNQPLPADLIRIEVEPTTIIMEGIYRVDELARYRTLIPSERAVLELALGCSSQSSEPQMQQILSYIEKRMTVAEICYHLHDSSFNIYSQLYDLVSAGLARVIDELPPEAIRFDLDEVPADSDEMLGLARRELNDNNSEKALSLIHRMLALEPERADLHALLKEAEFKFVEQVYAEISPQAVPRILLSPEAFTEQQLGPQEAFVLSRINGDWDIQSILSICPFREADSLRMIKTLRDTGVIGF